MIILVSSVLFMRTCKPAGSTLHSDSNKHNKIFPTCLSPPPTTVSRDREVQSPDPLPDKLLVVSIIKRDGTLLDVSSILEEDIVELCVRRAHTRPLGVLQYSKADSVVFFNNIADVNCTQQALPDVLEFRDEAIAIQTMALMQAHITAFIEMWCSNPATREGELHTPPY